MITRLNLAIKKINANLQAINMLTSGSRWLHKKLYLRPKSLNILLLSIVCSSLITTIVSANESHVDTEQTIDSSKIHHDGGKEASASIPANHKGAEATPSDDLVGAKITSPRHGRQYDSPMSTSSTGSYASVSGDGAYVGQTPISSSSYASSPMSSINANYVNDLSGNYHSAASYHDPLSMARGYPMPPTSYPPSIGSMSSMFGGLASASGPGGMSSSSMFPLMSKGFDVSEIVCTAIAVAIGAVIVGAPFILIYLFVMNQMNGNGPTMGPTGGGAISLTGPSSSTNVSGRRKRHTSFPEALFKQLSPLVNSEQAAQTFKLLVNSIAKYQK